MKLLLIILSQILLRVVLLALFYDTPQKNGYVKATAAGFLAITAIATTVTGTVMTVQGQRSQSKSEAKIAEYNASLAQNEADEAEKVARWEAEQHRRRAKQIIGSQRATFGASGVAMEGSPLLVLADTEKQLNIENSMIYRNAQITKNRYFQQSNIYGMQATGARTYSKYATIGSLLTGTGRAIEMGFQTGLIKLPEKPEKPGK